MTVTANSPRQRGKPRIRRSFEIPNEAGELEVWDDLQKIADDYDVSYVLVCKWANEGLLPATKFGRRRIVRRSDLGAFFRSILSA